MNYSEEIFIETSALVDYTLKKEYQEEIESIIKEYKTKLSSNYVRMELKKGIITYLVYLHNKILTCTEWSDAMKALLRLSATPQKHRLGAILEALQNFWSEIERKAVKDIQKENGGISLSEYLKSKSTSFIRLSVRRLWSQYQKIIDEDLNPMECFVDIQPPKQKENLLDNTDRTCNKSKYTCKIKEFFIENNQSLIKILKHLKNMSKDDIDNETEQRIKSLKEIQRLLLFKNKGIYPEHLLPFT